MMVMGWGESMAPCPPPLDPPLQEDRKILNTIWCRGHKWMGHVLRDDDALLRDVFEGRILVKTIYIEEGYS